MPTQKTAPGESILTKLKTQTESQHRRTEEGVSILSEDFSLEDYKLLLRSFYAFYKPFEERMAAALAESQIAFDYKQRLNIPKLQADLNYLGVPDSEIAAIAVAKDLPSLDTVEKIWGALYVVEGSTLGGQLIARHLQKKFGFTAERGAAFFSGYSAATGKMWNEFRSVLSDFAEQSVAEEEIIGSARETFEKIGQALAK